MKLVTAATMREMDRRTIEDFHIPSIVLMENAALRVVEAIVERYGKAALSTSGFGPLRPQSCGNRTDSLEGKRILVLCGKGNNGGDGFAIARHLGLRHRAIVDVRTAFPLEDVKGQSDAAVNLAMARECGEVESILPFAVGDFEAVARNAYLVIDALFGTGFRGAVEGDAARMIEIVNAVGAQVVAVDIPSGVNADTGAVEGAAIEANLTVTFALAKPGLVCYPGAENVGELVVADIGMPRQVVDEATTFAEVTEPEDVAAVVPHRENGRDTNKGKFGHVLVIAGSRGFLGAANMSAHAAVRVGAGLVTLAVPESLLTPAMSTVNPVIMTRGLPEATSPNPSSRGEITTGTFAKAAVDEVLKLAEKATAVAIGPGIGAHVGPLNNGGTELAEFVREVIRRCPVPVVVDADALNVLAAEADHGQAIVAGRSAATVLTPHPGEMGRLIGKSTAEVQADRFGVAKDVAERYRCTVLLKGARTVIASPDQPFNINTTGNAGMASGGMGDALTGVIGAQLGMKIHPHEAASAGAHVHGCAGDIAAERIGGKAGLLATDLIECLPAALGRIMG